MGDPTIVRWAREQQDWLAAQLEIITRYPIGDDPDLRRLALDLERQGWMIRETLMRIEHHASR